MFTESENDLPTVGNQFSTGLLHFCSSSEQSVGGLYYRLFSRILYSKQPRMRFHYILTGMNKIENTESTKFWIR